MEHNLLEMNKGTKDIDQIVEFKKLSKDKNKMENAVMEAKMFAYDNERISLL
jgi:hypothetical protein